MNALTRIVETALRINAKESRDASSVFNKAKPASAAVREVDQSPTAGKNIPIVLGSTNLTGEVIWIRTYRTSTNECRADVAVCFGTNLFGRPIGLMSLSQSGSYIYRKTGGQVVNPPKAVRFYDGTHTTADPLISYYEGADKTPAFKGYIYAVLEGILVASGIKAEFTDEYVEESSSSVTLDCDPDLSGVNMVYDYDTGMYYGILNPVSTESYFIRSLDNCKIFDAVRISFPRYDYQVYGGATPRFYPNIYPIRCSPMVVIPGRRMATLGPDPVQLSPLTYLYANPGRGIPSETGERVELHSESDYLLTDPPSPSPTYNYVESYPIPGTAACYAVLRIFDRSTALYPQLYSGIVTLPGVGNIACTIFNGQSGGLMDVPYGEPMGDSYYADEVTQVLENTYGGTDGGWGVKDAPEVDEIVYGRTDGNTIKLGAVRVAGSTVVAYRLVHEINGMYAPYAAVITLPDGLAYSGLDFDASSDQVLVSATADGSFLNSRLYKIGPDGTFSYVDLGLVGFKLMDRGQGRTYNGQAVITNDDNSEIYIFDIANESLSQVYSGDAAPGAVVDISRDLVSIPSVSGVTRYTAGQISPGDILLTDVIEACCAIKGYDPSELEFQNLSTYTVRGLQITSTIRLSDLFNRLGTLYSFSFVETDGKLKFVKKRTPGTLMVDHVLTENDLVLVEDGDGAKVRSVQRAGSANLLGGMDVEYVDPDKNFENTTIKIRRPVGSFDTGASERLETLSVPLTLLRADAYSLMYESFYNLLVRQTRVTFAVPSWHGQIEPGDCISVTVDGVSTTGIAVRVTISEDFSQEIEMEVFDSGGTTSLSSPEVITPPVVTTGILGLYIPLEIPFIRASDYKNSFTSIRYHGITSAEFGSWAYADVYRSLDNSTFSKIIGYTDAPMTLAVTQNSIDYPALEFAEDELSALTIRVVAGSATDFQSVSYLTQMNGANLCAYGNGDVWELISYRTVTENSDGTLTLTGLQRGLRGSHVNYAPLIGNETHMAGDYVIVLDPLTIATTDYLSSDRLQYESFAIKTSGHELPETRVGPIQFKNVAMSQVQPAAFVATHTAGSNNLVLTWEHVSCIPCEWSDAGVPGPMHAPLEYEIYISASGGPFIFYTTDRTYTWTEYGSRYGADSIVTDNVYEIYLTPRSSNNGWGKSAYAVPGEA